jgi:hypothetical protein
MIRLAFPLSILILLFASPPATSQGERSVRDWIAGCDNTRHCRAIGLAPEGEGTWAYLSFERSGAADAVVDQVLIALEGNAPGDGRWLLRSGGEPVFDLAAEQIRCEYEACAVIIDDPGQLERLFAEFRRSDRLTVDREGEVLALVSLAGASAVMLWIDETQRRLDTSTAFVRRGERDPLSIAAAPSPPRIRAETNAWTAVDAPGIAPLIASARADSLAADCDEPEYVPGDGEAWNHANGRQMLALACFAGAYNLGTLWLWRDDEGSVWSLVPMDAVDANGRLVRATEGSLINAGFDPDRGELHAFDRGRGVGDCGTVHAWLWNGEHFALESMHAMAECRGVAPEHWPRLWRARRE